MKCNEIADKIFKHLQRLEKEMKWYLPNCWGTTKVWIRYVDYQNNWSLTKQEAIKYLEWLEKGNKGEHYKIEKPPSPRVNETNP